MKLKADPLLCTGCRVCEMVCSFAKNETFSPSRSRITLRRFDDGRDVVVVCLDCKKPKCVESCQRGAITRVELGIEIDQERCDGCGACVGACVNGSLKIDPFTNVVISCDFCGECVQYCPPGVLLMK